MIKLKTAKILVANIFRVLIIITVFIAALKQNWLDIAFLIMILLITFIPNFVRKRLSIYYPNELEIIILLFIIASLYLGEINLFYAKIEWWDLMLHTLSGFILGQLGFALIYQLNKQDKVDIKLSPFFVAFFAFCFAMMTGVIWEIYEFSMDQLFGFSMQKSGLIDTMWDLIVNTIGAITVSIFGYIYLKNKHVRKVVKSLRNVMVK